MIDLASPDEAMAIGFSAENARRVDVAERAWTLAAEAGLVIGYVVAEIRSTPSTSSATSTVRAACSP